jgi:hypothetical protein
VSLPISRIYSMPFVAQMTFWTNGSISPGGGLGSRVGLDFADAPACRERVPSRWVCGVSESRRMGIPSTIG